MKNNQFTKITTNQIVVNQMPSQSIKVIFNPFPYQMPI